MSDQLIGFTVHFDGSAGYYRLQYPIVLSTSSNVAVKTLAYPGLTTGGTV